MADSYVSTWHKKGSCTSLTNGGQKTGNSCVVLVSNNLVLAEDVSADTLNDTDLSGALIIELAEGEWEGTELLDDLVQGLLGRITLETVGESGTAVESGAVLEVLELSGSERNTNLNTPDLTDLWKTLALALLTWSKDNLLLALNLVALKHPGSGVFDQVAVEALDDLLEIGSHLGLWDGLGLSSLGLLLDGSGSQKSSWDHQAEENLVGVVGSEHQVGDAGIILLLSLSWNDDGVANDCSETVDLGTELDLDDISGLQDDGSLSLIGLQWGIGGYECIWRNGRWVRNAYIGLISWRKATKSSNSLPLAIFFPR